MLTHVQATGVAKKDFQALTEFHPAVGQAALDENTPLINAQAASSPTLFQQPDKLGLLCMYGRLKTLYLKAAQPVK